MDELAYDHHPPFLGVFTILQLFSSNESTFIHMFSYSLSLLHSQEDYPVLSRVAEMNLLSKIAEAGILSTLSAKGLTLSQIERLLPVIDDLGLLNAGKI